MAGDLVLLTGATGHLGFRTLRTALEHGYNVRAAVRSEAKAELVRSNPVLKAINKDDQLSFVIVPDFIEPGAFDEVVKDVKYIIHVASPIPMKAAGDDFEKFFIQPAVQGTLGVFESARKSGTVKRIVVTSSVVAIVPPKLWFFDKIVDEVFNAESRQPEMEGPFEVLQVAYIASKVAALNRAEAWIKQEKPDFDVIHVYPSFILGRDDMADSTKAFQTGTNAVPLNIALGTADPKTQKACDRARPSALYPNSYNNVNDCAKVHVLALDPKVEGNQGFIVSSTGMDGMTWKEANRIVAKHFPDAVKDGRLPNTGGYETIVCKVDSSKTEETFGVKFTNFEASVVSVVGHYLEVLDKESKGQQTNGH
ncbi:hypothetical protein LTR36_008572 [Oleoguttula mirabilis]|uniref:NAD-dependent epimerase/dehydratase domain-containing protein n=1 Tax=Oleoguttula mirabilis TaxID=1507867 RepID=A0AAV9JTH4_9PEZI|nr:hypothetical protein LTR36_008572 [Oleoguttula mirabilis]